MYICQLPVSVQERLQKELTRYLMSCFPGENVEGYVALAMSEKLQNVLDTTPEATAYGLTSERYNLYL